MNRKAQSGILGAIFGVIFLVLIWALAAGGLIKQYGEEAIVTYGYTGIIAFILANLNIFVFIGIILGVFIIISSLGR